LLSTHTEYIANLGINRVHVMLVRLDNGRFALIKALDNFISKGSWNQES